MNDLGEYLAKRYCAQANEIAKRSGVEFAKGLYKIDSIESNSLLASQGYRISFEDLGNYVRVTFDGKRINVGEAIKKIGKLSVPNKYKDILSSVKVSERRDRLCVDAHFSSRDNSSDRIQNEDKVYFSIRNSVVKPVFKAIMKND